MEPKPMFTQDEIDDLSDMLQGRTPDTRKTADPQWTRLCEHCGRRLFGIEECDCQESEAAHAD